jgi:Fe2+ or Zn2+ uptake regulation protein/rubrerythrin
VLVTAAKLRMTPQRQAILEELRRHALHPTADEVHALVRRRLPRVSLGTVYRNLEMLSDCGLVQKLAMGGQRRFDGNTRDHYHVRCVRCGRVEDAPVEPMTAIDDALRKVSGYQVMGHRLEFIGVCPACWREGQSRAFRSGRVEGRRHRQTRLQEDTEVKPFSNANEALDFAIRGEEQAHQFYSNLADRADDPQMRLVFEGFAEEELGHKAKLLAIRHGSHTMPAPKDVVDLEVAEYLPDVEPTQDLDYLQALVLAMKAEKAAFKLYSDLAAISEDDGVCATLLSLAQEEAKHKLRFEIEYDSRTVGLAPDPEM